MTYILG